MASSGGDCTGIQTAVESEDDNVINFVEMKFINNMLYFKSEDDENLESDHFAKLEPKLSVIRNVKNQVLFIDQKKQLLFEDMPDTDSNKSQVKFKIFMYRDSLIRGLAVAISVEYNEISTLSCENKTLSFKNISPPDNISDTKSDIIFFQSKVPGHNKMQFESSSYEGHFLACVKENDLFKLTLKKKGDCKDKSVMFTVEAN